MNINTTDLTYKWGEAVNPQERLNGKWRQALYQDINESFDSKFLYFLYDKVEDQKCQTTGMSNGESGLVIFDTDARCFAGNIPLHYTGTLKFLFSLKCPSPQMGSSLILVTEDFHYGVNKLNIFRLNMSENGLCVAESRPLLLQPISVSGQYICTIREDVPEIIVLAGPGLQVFRMDCMTDVPSNPLDYFFIPDAELSHFYDGFVHKGRVVLLSAHKDGYLDWSRVHTFPITGTAKIVSYFCTADSDYGFPSPRKNCGLDSFSKGIMVAGGEFGQVHGEVTRLRDYWMLDLVNYQWKMLQGEMPCDLIEPRLCVTNTGNIYLWGDYDVPMADLPLQHGTHIRIFKITGLEEPHLSYLKSNVHPMAQEQIPAKEAYFNINNFAGKNAPVAFTQNEVIDTPKLNQDMPSPQDVIPVIRANGQQKCIQTLRLTKGTEVSFEDPVYRATVEEKKEKKHRKFCCFQ